MMAKLSSKKRASLPSKVFAGPGRSFPVNDVTHAKAAILDSGHAADPAAIKARAKAALKKMTGK